MEDIVKRLTKLEKRVDSLIKPEVPSGGMSLIEAQVLAANVTTITFSSIPQTFRHLILITYSRSDDIDNIRMRFNGSATNIYDWAQIFGAEPTAAATGQRATSAMNIPFSEGSTSRANNYAPGFTIIFNYSIPIGEKNALGITMEYGATVADVDLVTALRSGRWRNTAAITSILLFPETGGNFLTGSRFELYGLA